MNSNNNNKSSKSGVDSNIAKGLQIPSLAHRDNTISKAERAVAVVNLNGFRPKAQNGIVVGKEKQLAMRMVVGGGSHAPLPFQRGGGGADGLDGENDDDNNNDKQGGVAASSLHASSDSKASGTDETASDPNISWSSKQEGTAKPPMRRGRSLRRVSLVVVEDPSTTAAPTDTALAESPPASSCGGDDSDDSDEDDDSLDGAGKEKKKKQQQPPTNPLSKLQTLSKRVRSLHSLMSLRKDRQFDKNGETSPNVKELIKKYPQGKKRNWIDVMLSDLSTWHISGELHELVGEDVAPTTSRPKRLSQANPPSASQQQREPAAHDRLGRGSIVVHVANIMMNPTKARESVERVRRPLPPPPPDPKEVAETERKRKVAEEEKKKKDEESIDPDQLFADLVWLLSTTKVVEDLGLFNCIHPFDSTRMLVLCHRGLMATPLDAAPLTKLTISLCGLTDDAFNTLCEYISATPRKTITSLDVSHNSITPAGVSSAASVLPGTSVRCLSLHGNRLGPEGTQALTDVLLQCFQLQELDIGFCRLNTQVGDALFPYLSTINNLHTLNVDGMNLSTTTAMVLLRCVGSNRSLTQLSVRFSTSCSSKAFKERLAAMLMRNEKFQEARREHRRQQQQQFEASSTSTTTRPPATPPTSAAASPAAAAAAASSPSANSPSLESLNTHLLEGTATMAHIESMLLMMDDDAADGAENGAGGSAVAGAFSSGYGTYTTNEPTRPAWSGAGGDGGDASVGQRGDKSKNNTSSVESSSTTSTATSTTPLTPSKPKTKRRTLVG